MKIPAKRPSQIETLRFDLKRRSHRAIRSFRSITVLRKRSERRALRRGSLWRISFASFFGRAKKEARRRRRDRETKRRDKRRIRRSPENCPLRRGRKQDEGFSRCGATPFLLAEKKRGKETARGDLFRGGPLKNPSPTTKGAAAPIGFPTFGRETGGYDGQEFSRCGGGDLSVSRL